jgi:hypothetical protein
MPRDRGIRPHFPVGPAAFAFHLLVALLDPQPQAIPPAAFRERGRGAGGGRGAGRARPR